jgi:hypothetical protein
MGGAGGSRWDGAGLLQENRNREKNKNKLIKDDHNPSAKKSRR